MANNQKLGWIGMGRMGFPMAERLIRPATTLSIWNRTRAKAEPLAAKGAQGRRQAARSCARRRAVRDRVDRQGPQEVCSVPTGVGDPRRVPPIDGRLVDHRA